MPPRSGSFNYTAVDLFSGAGGLSVGLEKAGFDVVSAVEIYKPAVDTYRQNHQHTCVLESDIKQISGTDLLKLSPTGKIDLIAGCPPCQGFSTLTNKYKRRDPRNELALEMLRLILEVQPRLVMMENVPGLARKGKTIFDRFVKTLEENGYVVNFNVLQVADYGVPQMRKRLVLLAGKGFSVDIPEGNFSATGGNGKKKWQDLKSVIANAPIPVTLSKSMKLGGPRACKWNVVRDLSSINQERLKHALPGQGRRFLPKELRPKCHADCDEGFSNVYGRLSWDKPSVTITAGCTTLSKGRFGHPDALRTLSVREAALIQTFPPNYDFVTPYMEQACIMIGNALPCRFAKVLAQRCYDALEQHEKS